jgi:hypothetical protein
MIAIARICAKQEAKNSKSRKSNKAVANIYTAYTGGDNTRHSTNFIRGIKNTEAGRHGI